VPFTLLAAMSLPVVSSPVLIALIDFPTNFRSAIADPPGETAGRRASCSGHKR
jgi:hypothetical protein